MQKLKDYLTREGWKKDLEEISRRGDSDKIGRRIARGLIAIGVSGIALGNYYVLKNKTVVDMSWGLIASGVIIDGLYLLKDYVMKERKDKYLNIK